MVDYKDLGNRIRLLRRKRSLTQEELAEQVGISASFMGHIERGTRIASLETLVALCNVLRTTPQSLLVASLNDDLEDYLPEDFTPELRSKLSAFLRIAQDAVENWPD